MTSADTARHAFWACVAQIGYTSVAEFIFDVISTHSYLSKQLNEPSRIKHIMHAMTGASSTPVVYGVFRTEFDSMDYVDQVIEDCFQSMMDLLVDYGYYPEGDAIHDVMLVIRNILELMRSFTKMNSKLENCMMILHRQLQRVIMIQY